MLVMVDEAQIMYPGGFMAKQTSRVQTTTQFTSEAIALARLCGDAELLPSYSTLLAISQWQSWAFLNPRPVILAH